MEATDDPRVGAVCLGQPRYCVAAVRLSGHGTFKDGEGLFEG